MQKGFCSQRFEHEPVIDTNPHPVSQLKEKLKLEALSQRTIGQPSPKAESQPRLFDVTEARRER